MKKFLILVLAIPFFLITNQKSALSGAFTDELARCMVNSTTLNEKIIFMEWTIRLLSEHPELKDLVQISENQKITMDKKLGNVFTTLVAERCKEETEKAIKFEGYEQMVSAFGALGAASTRAITTHPDVMKSSQDYAKYIDFSSLDFPEE